MKNIGQCCHAVSEDERRDKHISQSHHPTSENSLATSSSTRSSLNELFDCSLAAQDKILRRNNSKEKMVFRIIIALIVLLYAMRHTVAELKKLNRQRFSYGLASPETNVPQNVSNAVASSAISEQMNCPQIEWNASSETHLKSRKSRCDFSLKNSYMNVEPSKCTCRDPFQPWDRTVEDKPHQAKVENAIAWQQSLLEEVRRSNEKVDVVFYGSSILEYWLGTYYGKTQNKKSIETFYPFFGGSAHNATLNGLIMAMSGDTTGSLWNGIATERTLPDWLEPSVIWIVIGTNDMAHFMCSADAVNFAAMKLVSHIRSMRPNAKIVLNSQLPVNNGSLLEDPADTVNRQINTFRSCLAAAEPHVYFFNATDLFLADNDHINTTLYREDFIHPHTPGYLVWGKAMADYIEQLLVS